MLILDVGKVVASVNCIPDECLWDSSDVSQRSDHMRESISRVLLTARMDGVHKLEKGLLGRGHS
jgi:hypothetical protein